MLTMMRVKPSTASELAVAHACLSGLGLIDTEFQNKLLSVFKSPLQKCSERLPWKEIEAGWFSRISGIDTGHHSDKVTDQLILSKGFDVLSASREELYAFTHALIYTSDFGRSDPDLKRSKTDVCSDVDCALARCLDEDDFDLAAELLMTWPCLRVEWSKTARFALSVLKSVEDEVGFLPSLSLRNDEFACLSSNEQEEYFLAESYHTIYVMGILCALSLLKSGSESRSSEADTLSPSSKVIRDFLIPRAPVPQWEKYLQKFIDMEGADLTPFLTTIALGRSLHDSNFVSIRNIIQHVAENEFLMTPAVVQTASIFQLLID